MDLSATIQNEIEIVKIARLAGKMKCASNRVWRERERTEIKILRRQHSWRRECGSRTEMTAKGRRGKSQRMYEDLKLN